MKEVWPRVKAVWPGVMETLPLIKKSIFYNALNIKLYYRIVSNRNVSKSYDIKSAALNVSLNVTQ